MYVSCYNFANVFKWQLSKCSKNSYSVGMKTLSVTLIVRNEETNLARLLPELTFADEVVVVDTGSTDNTVNVASNYTDNVYRFTWIDDFAKARNYAISKATSQYVMWLDADDVIPENTKKCIMGWKKSPDTADVYYLKYRLDGEFPFWFWRERIVRNCNKCRFKGFIHEVIIPFGEVKYLDCEVLHKPTASHEQRNLSIYRKAIAERRRFTLRDKFYYAKTLIECNQADDARDILQAFARNNHAYVVDRVEAYKLLANDALSRDVNEALSYLARSVRLLPPNGETCCLFGNCYMKKHDFRHAAQWYTYALNSHSQSGFINEYYVNFLPHVQLSVCLWYLGDRTNAKFHHEAAKAISPNNPTVLANDIFFNS